MWLPCDILLKADRMTMASSLELRVPYLDLEVLRAAEGLSDRLLVRGKNGKCVFRKVAERVIGKENAYRKKKGFPVPFREWIRQKKYTEILENSFKGSVAESFFDTDRLNSLLVSHVNGKENNARVLYTVFAFIKWYEIYFSNGVKNPSLGADKLKNDTVPMISVTRKEKRNEKMDGDHTRI
jgi:asparagine synthase (glutamine-hydrolysing)